MIYLTDDIADTNKHDLAIYGIASLLVYHPQDVHRLLEQKYNTQVSREQLLDTVNKLLYDSYEFRLDIAELIQEKNYVKLDYIENNGEYSNFLCIGGKRLGVFTSEACEAKQADRQAGNGNGDGDGLSGILGGGLFSGIATIFGGILGGTTAQLESQAQIEQSRNKLTEAVLELEKEKVKQRGTKTLIIGGIAIAAIIALALIFRKRT